jgi:2'-5' RNA ligase
MRAIVAYPQLDEADRHWIESFRAKHDPQASRIDVHFTLVFPLDVMPGDVDREMATIAQDTEPIPFAIDRVQVVRNVFGEVSQIFLVPNEGSRQIATLHDRLYGGALQTHLRADIPFIPHMTVGSAPTPQCAQELVKELDLGNRRIRGVVSEINLISLSAERVESIGVYALGVLVRTPPPQ